MRISGKRELDFLKKIGFVRTAGSKEEFTAATMIQKEIEAIGLPAVIEPFEIKDATIIEAAFTVLEPYEKSYTVTAYKCCKNTPKEGAVYDFLYVEDLHEVNLANARDKFVLFNGRNSMENYKKLIKANVAGFITMDGSLLDKKSETDLSNCKIRENLATQGLLTGLNIRICDAFELISRKASKVKVLVTNKDVTLTSHNVCTELKGTTYPDEVISIGGHYDSVEFSTGVYDNGAGSVINLELLRYFKENPPKRTLRFMWYGSEEIGLEGSKHYVKAHEDQLSQHVLMINVDVAGPVIGSEVAYVTAEESLAHYTDFFMKTNGYPVNVKQDIYSSDNMPYANLSIPAISFCRFAPNGGAFIHSRNDVMKYLSSESLAATTEYILKFTETMANAVAFPVPRTMPANMVEKIDKYLFKKELEEAEKAKETKDTKK
ncbi:MAG: M28 family peptidase [Lachnospiraceae bacterium]